MADELTDAQVDAAIPAEVYTVHEGEGRWTAATLRAAYRAGYQAGRTPAVRAHKPRVLVDFDGVVHRYSKGWHDGTAYDEPMPGAREALVDLQLEGYDVVIFSTRNAADISQWMRRHGFRPLQITNEKLPAVAIIDDRAIRFIEWPSALADLLRLYPVA